MKGIIRILRCSLPAICFLLVSSCEDYLDKAPESGYSEKDIFGNFRSFQGWVEQMYNCFSDHEKSGNWSQYLFADETVSWRDTYPFDRGDYWGNSSGYLYGKRPNEGNISMPYGEPNSPRQEARCVWEWAWYAIAVANYALTKLEEPDLFQGTEEEYKLLKGQALYLRAWFHFEICRFWGGMPYIGRSLKADEDWSGPEFSRTNFRETALKMAEDFRAAAKILPVHWDLTETGQETADYNRDRANKMMALGYLGKTFLFAASPMINEEATGNNSYDAVLCDSAANVFGELFTLVDKHSDLFGLEPWERYIDNFCIIGTGGTAQRKPGQYEGLMMPTIYKTDGTWWNGVRAILPRCMGGLWQEDIPTHNIVLNFGDDRGYPLIPGQNSFPAKHPDSDSQFDGAYPWKNRDPRFYQVIVHDGEKFNAFSDLAAKIPNQNYLQSYRGGVHAGPSEWEQWTTTGYYQKKLNGVGPETTAQMLTSYQAYVPFLRLADCYLMYAEAVNFKTGGGPNATSDNYKQMTAAGAVDKVRRRDLSAAEFRNPVPAIFKTSKEVFFEELVRERAVELCFESQRFDDLRRWNRIDDPRYLDKTEFKFDRDPNDPEKVINQVVELRIRRTAEKKHRWLPLQRSWAQQFPNFQQNPGW